VNLSGDRVWSRDKLRVTSTGLLWISRYAYIAFNKDAFPNRQRANAQPAGSNQAARFRKPISPQARLLRQLALPRMSMSRMGSQAYEIALSLALRSIGSAALGYRAQ
jgi:hypothetical protein